MMRYVAQFVGTGPDSKPITHIAHTPNYAVQGVYNQLEEKLAAITSEQIDDIFETGKIPERLSCSSFERDARAVLYGSDDLRPHITVRTLPPKN